MIQKVEDLSTSKNMLSVDVEVHRSKAEIYKCVLVIVSGTVLFCSKEDYSTLLIRPFHLESITKFQTSNTAVPAAAITLSAELTKLLSQNAIVFEC